MTAIDPHVPVRTCVGCRSRRPAGDLVRVTHDRERVTVGGASAGRGAWVCRDRDGTPDRGCVDTAVRTGGFARAWRIERDPRLDAAVRAVTGDEGMTTGKG